LDQRFLAHVIKVTGPAEAGLDAGQTVALFVKLVLERLAASGINAKDIPSLVERNHEVTIKSFKDVQGGIPKLLI
jgi:hypothetical protein